MANKQPTGKKKAVPYYLGLTDKRRVVIFQSETTPTPATHKHLYIAWAGPYKTKARAWAGKTAQRAYWLLPKVNM